MRQNNIYKHLAPAGRAPWAWLALACALIACSEQRAAPRVIRAHSRILQDIAHADPAATAGRYCVYCHGVALQGGGNYEPSCFTCHGTNWYDPINEATRAPSTHTILNQGFNHQNGLFSPLTNCVPCHGADLSGSIVSGVGIPSCLLCHAELWQQRTPPKGQY